MKTALPAQARALDLDIPAEYTKWINIKRSFEACYKEKAYGMTSMLDSLQLPLVGRHHSGIDDCTNIVSIAKAMLEDGFVFEYNGIGSKQGKKKGK